MVRDREVHNRVSFDINPSSRQTLQALIAAGHFDRPDPRRCAQPSTRLQRLHRHGSSTSRRPYFAAHRPAELPQAVQEPAKTASTSAAPKRPTASALTGVITDPRDAGLIYHPIAEPAQLPVNEMMFMAPIDTDEARATQAGKDTQHHHTARPRCRSPRLGRNRSAQKGR